MPTTPAAETISVLLCTQDGTAFVTRQVDSILAQTRPLDELIVCDDCSQDGTLDLVRQQAAALGHQLVTVANDQQLGPAQNFAQAIRLATGSLLVFADQDDEWEPERLAVIEATFASDPTIAAVFHDGRLIDAHGALLRRGLWQANGVRAGRQAHRLHDDLFGQLLRWNVVTGAALAMRASVRSLVLPIPDVGMHDQWVGLLTAALGSLRAVDQPLIRYRVHGANAVGVPSKDPRSRVSARRADASVRHDELRMFTAALERLTATGVPVPARGALEDKVSFLRERIALPARAMARVPQVARHLLAGRYHRLGHGARSALHDVMDGT